MGPSQKVDQWEDLRESVGHLLRLRPTASNPAGLRAVAGELDGWLRRLGFNVQRHSDGGGPDVLVATREGEGRAHLGLAGHYDVEEAGDGWSAPPFEVTLRDGRLYGRGLGDNLGPLCLRLLSLATSTGPTPKLTFVLQGEEETGSFVAHRVYPKMGLPAVDLWLEETGYFEMDGNQRMLVRRPDGRAQRWIDAAVHAAKRHGRSVRVHDRHMNKAFGEHRCPFLTHLAGSAPYLAIGPNDPGSRIHQPDESLPVANLAVSVDQFRAVLRSAAEES